ncbi:hypothetical protein [Hoeflea poritis]|uniref:Exostosin GT47 domain-containing protein n=1 Tax=Hoeflea poritis TaxID=2993659 RepID=A0ABT4VGH5_9HYPH|nr:hypothetical protein [Hoeflea poritis]MDA4843801.1 hypothetical protein [Hoeflea poritis]
MGLRKRTRRLTRHTGASLRYWRYRLGGGRPDETNCQFVGSHGLKKICDYWHPREKPPSAEQLEKLIQNGGSPPKIHLRANHLHTFADRIRERFDSEYILVTGCTDGEISTTDIEMNLLMELLEDTKLLAWFGQNCNIDHPKLHRLPIGLDYHTLSSGPRFRPWGYFASPVAQERSLNETRRGAPPLREKSVRAYCNWHHILSRGDRLRCINSVAYDTIHLEQLNIERILTWRNNTKHLFTISPFGEGLDCHRTWEAILLGSVPIVPRSGISPLFAKLPVCIVDDWSEVTPGYLEQKREWVLETEFDFAPLYLDWWRKRLVGASGLPERLQTFQSFVDTAHTPLGNSTHQTVRVA